VDEGIGASAAGAGLEADALQAIHVVVGVGLGLREGARADAPADCNTTNDIITVDQNTFRLRAERNETGSGRIYTIRYRATDALRERDGHNSAGDGADHQVIWRSQVQVLARLWKRLHPWALLRVRR